MKQRRPRQRKPSRQPKKRLAPAPPPGGQIGALPRRASNAALDPIGTAQGPLTLRSSGEGEGGLSADTTVMRAAQHLQMLSWIEVLEVLLVELPNKQGGIGHNLQPITKEDVEETTRAIAILKVQPVTPKAPDEAKAAASTLKKIGERLGTYLDTFLLEASKSAGKEFGKQLGRLPYWIPVWYVLMKIAQSAANWLG